MKIRNGFVSNSSSSSFVVGFEKVPATVEELMGMMFDENRDSVSLGYYEDGDYHTYEIAERVFIDMQGQERVDREYFEKVISEGWFEGYPETDYSKTTPSEKFRRKYEEEHDGQSIYDDEKAKKEWQAMLQKEWDIENAKIDEAAKVYADKYWPELSDLICYHFTYGDEDGPFYATLEHGNIFEKLLHVQISHH